MLKPRAKSSIMELPTYVGGRSTIADTKQIFKLSANENPLGASKDAILAYKDTATCLEKYPDGHTNELRECLAEHHKINVDRIVCGNGSGELLQYLAHAYLQAGDEAIHTEHGFLLYPLVISATGAKPVRVVERDLTTDVDKILNAVTKATKMIFLANPNNPTGTMISLKEIKRLHAGLRSDILLIIDEAYIEYVDDQDMMSGTLALSQNSKNIVILRTFSKLYGLAALRLGWAYAPQEITNTINKIRAPFNVSQPAMNAGIAAIKDTNHVKRSINHNNKWRQTLINTIHSCGFETVETYANFILIHFPETGGITVDRADQIFISHKVIVRQLGAYHLPNSLRLSIGTKEANESVISAFEFMKESI